MTYVILCGGEELYPLDGEKVKDEVSIVGMKIVIRNRILSFP